MFLTDTDTFAIAKSFMSANQWVHSAEQLRERSLLLVYSRFIVDLKVYSNHKQQSLSAHSTVESAECTQCV